MRPSKPWISPRPRASCRPRLFLLPSPFFSQRSGYVSCSSTTICSRFTPSQDSMINELDCTELGLSCTEVCRTLDRGTNGKKQDELSPSAYDTMNQLMLWVEPTIWISNRPLTFSQSQDGGRYSDEANQVGQTECDISTFLREER